MLGLWARVTFLVFILRVHFVQDYRIENDLEENKSKCQEINEWTTVVVQAGEGHGDAGEVEGRDGEKWMDSRNIWK